MPRLEADGTLVFSDDDADSPYKAPQRHSVVVRSRHDKTVCEMLCAYPLYNPLVAHCAGLAVAPSCRAVTTTTLQESQPCSTVYHLT